MKRDHIDPRPKVHPAVVPARMKSIRYSSSSQSTRSGCSSLSPRRHRVTRGVGPTVKPPPRRMPSQPRNAAPPGRPEKAPEEKQEGRLKRFRDKLAVIFHHHHHHHHHLHDGGHAEAGERGGPHRHMSPWAYLRSTVGRTSKGKGNELARASAARMPGQQRQHGYLYAMIEGLIQHVWGMRRRKRAKIGSRAQQRNKVHWWQRLRRRRGRLRLANKKAPRLRLGFNRSQSRNDRNKNG